MSCPEEDAVAQFLRYERRQSTVAFWTLSRAAAREPAEATPAAAARAAQAIWASKSAPRKTEPRTAVVGNPRVCTLHSTYTIMLFRGCPILTLLLHEMWFAPLAVEVGFASLIDKLDMEYALRLVP